MVGACGQARSQEAAKAARQGDDEGQERGAQPPDFKTSLP